MSRRAGSVAVLAASLILALGAQARAQAHQTPAASAPDLNVNAAIAPAAPATEPPAPLDSPAQLARSLQTVALFGLASMLPAAVMMLSAFVRISVVLTLLRQALGSPQVPGNQVILALSLLLAAIVMWPVGTEVYDRGISPYAAGTLDAVAAFEAGSAPVRDFMIRQISRAGNDRYAVTLWQHAEPERAARTESAPTWNDIPLRVIAPAFLLSELTTALFIGFALYLPFLVTDLVVSAVLSAMGLFMLPPALVAMPLKLILFVLADGWLLVADMLLRSFAP